jgi:PAS domain S-box-containing protein
LSRLQFQLSGKSSLYLDASMAALSAGRHLLSNDPDHEESAEQLPFLRNLLFSQEPALQLIYDTAPIGLAFLSPDCRYLQINQRLTEICGLSVQAHIGRSVRDCVPALAESVENIVRSIMETGQPVIGIEVAGQRADQGSERSWITYWHPLRGPDGEIAGVNVAAEEITERKRAEAAVRASERQFRTLAESIPQLVWMAEANGEIFWFNDQWYDYAGVPTGGITGRDWQAILDPAVIGKVRRRWARSLAAGTAFEMELLLRGKGGLYSPFLTRVVPLSDADSTVYGWIGTHIDISEQRRREEHIRFIIDELSHRTKNLLAVIMAVANQTARHADDVAQYQARFAERLTALSYSHDLLVRDSWQGASFGDVVSAQLKPFQETNEGRIDATGPQIILKPDAVQNLGLALHELATNASKHGALSGPDGKVSIRWLLNPTADRVCLYWIERNGPVVAPPQHRGFGHMVIEQIVPRALNGIGTLEFSSTGVSWAFEFPATLCD